MQSTDFQPRYYINSWGKKTLFNKWCNNWLCIWASLVAQLVKNPPAKKKKKEPACNGDSGVIPGSGRSPGEGVGYPLQYSWVSLMAQMEKNLPAMQETWVQSLGWEDPPEEGVATHSSILAWRSPMDRGAWWATAHGVTKSWTWLND